MITSRYTDSQIMGILKQADMAKEALQIKAILVDRFMIKPKCRLLSVW